jgi:hypothetical protein
MIHLEPKSAPLHSESSIGNPLNEGTPQTPATAATLAASLAGSIGNEMRQGSETFCLLGGSILSIAGSSLAKKYQPRGPVLLGRHRAW